MRTSAAISTPSAVASCSHPADSFSRAPSSLRSRVLKRWCADMASGRHRSDTPHESCTHSKSPLGFGRDMTTNIIGIGMDATEIDRIELTIERYGDRFLRRIFTDGEIAYATKRRNPVPHFAGRFAAKEAAMKALGTGHSRGVLWRDIEVVRAPGEAPQLRFHGGAARRFAFLKANSSLLTITHSQTLAIAQVMLLL